MNIKKDSDSLIEVTEAGARIWLDRDKQVFEEEHERMLAKLDVDHNL